MKVTASMGLVKYIRIFNGFCDKESKGHNRYKDYDILLTTTPFIGTRYNMTEANVFIMFDPLWMQKDQK